LVGNLGALYAAKVDDKINIKLYTYWSIADNFEWSEGYDSRFGLLWIHYEPDASGKKWIRAPKQSYKCYQRIIANRDNNQFPEEDCPLH
jgi:beta-glucosidase/6-phospho-beta-glucosidase/beta-galactosidase